MIGAPLHTGETSEVIPVAPRADVRAPLVMERLLQSRATPEMRQEAEALGTIARSLGPAWQRLISSEFTGYDAQYIYERFVGVTLRDLSLALRNSERVLPLDVVRTIAGVLFDGFASLSLGARPNRPLPLTDRSLGLGIDGQWRFAIGGLNHWLADVLPPELVADPEYDGNVSPPTRSSSSAQSPCPAASSTTARSPAAPRSCCGSSSPAAFTPTAAAASRSSPASRATRARRCGCPSKCTPR